MTDSPREYSQSSLGCSRGLLQPTKQILFLLREKFLLPTWLYEGLQSSIYCLMLHLAGDFTGYSTCFLLHIFWGYFLSWTVRWLTSVWVAVYPPGPNPKELDYLLRKTLVRHIIPKVGMPLAQHVISNFAGKRFQHSEGKKGLFDLIVRGQLIEI